MATHWPPITITLTEEGARIYTAGVLTTTLGPSPHIHAEAMAAARLIAASYKRTLPVTATSPDGEFHMLLTPEGNIHTEETPDADTHPATGPRPSATEQSAPETTETTAELATLPHTLPHPAHTPEVLPTQATPTAEDTEVLQATVSDTEVPAAREPRPTSTDSRPEGHGRSTSQQRRAVLVIPSVLAALIAATGIAVHSLNATSEPVAASHAPSPISTFLDIPPRPTPHPTPTPSTPKPSPTASASTPQGDATPQESAVPEEAAQPAPAQVSEQPADPQPAAPAAVDPPQTVPDVSDGLSAMNTSISTPGGGSATVTVHVQGSGTTLVSVTVGGVSTTITTTAPGNASATLTGLPTGAQSWTTSADGLVNSGTVTVY